MNLKQIEKHVKNQEEVEKNVSKVIKQIYLGLMGRVVENIETYVLDTKILVVLQNVLSVSERNAIKNPMGRKIIKETFRTIVENSRDQFLIAASVATDVDVVEMHHDISLDTGKEIIVFSLAKPIQGSEINFEQ
jgi:uncharacterized protein YbcI